MKRTQRVGLLLLLIALAACESGSPTEPEDVTFAASLGIDLTQMTRLESGVYIQTVTPAPATNTQVLRVQDWMAAHYKTWLPDGTLIDSSPPPYNEFVLNAVPGWALGVVGMKVGEVRKIVIPSELGYGENPPGSEVPKHSVLIFEVELASIN